jgi:hypothetical protein
MISKFSLCKECEATTPLCRADRLLPDVHPPAAVDWMRYPSSMLVSARKGSKQQRGGYPHHRHGLTRLDSLATSTEAGYRWEKWKAGDKTR